MTVNLTAGIIAALRQAGVEAYPPGVHEGICRAPYCVVRQTAGTRLSPAAGQAHYRVHLYVPCQCPHLLDTLAESVREALAPLENGGRLTLAQPRGPVLTDDTFRAACSYIDYVSYYRER